MDAGLFVTSSSVTSHLNVVKKKEKKKKKKAAVGEGNNPQGMPRPQKPGAPYDQDLDPDY